MCIHVKKVLLTLLLFLSLLLLVVVAAAAKILLCWSNRTTLEETQVVVAQAFERPPMARQAAIAVVTCVAAALDAACIGVSVAAAVGVQQLLAPSADTVAFPWLVPPLMLTHKQLCCYINCLSLMNY